MNTPQANNELSLLTGGPELLDRVEPLWWQLRQHHADLPSIWRALILDSSFDIAIRPGQHCAPYVHRAIGTFPGGTVRVSPGPFSTAADVDQLARRQFICNQEIRQD